MTRTIDVQQFINGHRISRTQTVILLLCFLIVAVDGFAHTCSPTDKRITPFRTCRFG